MSNTIVTGEVRLSYVSLFEPRANQNGGDPKYQVTVLLPKSDTATKAAIDREIQAELQNGVATKFGGQMPAMPAIPIHDGDGRRPNGEPFGEECRGCWVFTASTKQRPEVVDENCQPILSATSVYSGCYGRVSIRFFAYNQAGKKGIGCGLGNVQKLRDGEPLGGGSTAAQDFGSAAAAFTPGQPAPYQQQPQQYGMPAQQYGAPAQQPAYTQQPYSAPVQQPAPYQQQPQQSQQLYGAATWEPQSQPAPAQGFPGGPLPF